MAGLFPGIPVGTFKRSGADFSPYLSMQEMRMREAENLRQEALSRAQLGSDREFSFLNMEAKKAAAERDEALERDRMAQDQAQYTGAQDFSREQAAENERREVARRQAALLDREADRKAQEQETRRTESREDQKQSDILARITGRENEARAKETAAKTEETNRIQVRTKVRSIIADRVSNARAQGDNSTPEQLRDMMMAETQNEELTPADREEAQLAIQEWYSQQVKDEGVKFTRTMAGDAAEEKTAARADRTAGQKASVEQRAQASREAATVRRISILQDDLQDLRQTRLKAIQARSIAESEAEAATWDGEIAALDEEISAVRGELTDLSALSN